MIILNELVHGMFRDSTSLPQDIRNLLFTGCLELVHFTPRPGIELERADDCLVFLKKYQHTDTIPESSFNSIDSGDLPGWFKWLMKGIASFYTALAVSQQRGDIRTVNAIKESLWHIRHLLILRYILVAMNALTGNVWR